ncbi:MAG: AAA family ATPase [Pseudomonadota bacterium]|nr:AAA family ATPase [Pseudomonadota bacterium]
MQEVIILAGPNGAGKTTFASEYLSAVEERLEFVNADEIAREVAAEGTHDAQQDIRAGRIMLQRISALVESRVEFMFETTLASLVYARKVPVWQSLGYSVALIYLRLPSVEQSIARVQTRVEAGGHGIPDVTIRRRFVRSANYLERIYKPIVDEWYIWDSLEGDFALAESWDD